MNFNNRLKNIRSRANITQKTVSDYLGVSLRTYQRYEEGTIVPPLSTIVDISKFFDIPTDCLLCNGFFSNWDEIILHKDEILLIIKENLLSPPDILSLPNLTNLTENQLARILPAVFTKITFNDDGTPSCTFYLSSFLNRADEL